MNMNYGGPVLQLIDLRRTFRQGTREIQVLAGASVDLYPGQAIALVGPSGTGKSTLLHIAGLLETPGSGQVIVSGRDCTAMDDGERTRVRRAEMGFIYQFHQLLPEFSALENVALPQLILGRGRKEAEARASQLLSGLGLGGASRSPAGATFGRRAAAYGDLSRTRQSPPPNPCR